MPLSSCTISGPGDEASGAAVAGGTVRWVLGNNGSVAWPSGTTLRLVGGPVVLCPVVEVPAVAAGQTCDVELEVMAKEEPAEVYYSLVTPEGQPFGELAHASVAAAPAPEPALAEPPAPKPAAALVASPMDGLDGGVEALQGEVKTIEWTLANVGHAAWPEDVTATLIYNTPGFLHLPTTIDLPALQAGMTVHAGVSVLMPESEGSWKAMWAVTSPSAGPEFGEVLFAEFDVSAFPFMDWMLADNAKADCISEVSSQDWVKEDSPNAAMATTNGTTKKRHSVALALQYHSFLGAGEVNYDAQQIEDNTYESLGQVSGVPAGGRWICELALTNDGTEAWPGETALLCCFGSGLGCGRVDLPGGGAVQAGETVLVQMELEAPVQAPCRSAWVLASGQDCFGPPMLLDVVA